MWDKDFYWIFEDHGVKKIHVVGYYYNTDSDNGHGTARLVMYGYYVMPLSEFLTIDRETYESEVRQYIEEFTTEKALSNMRHFFGDDKVIKYLSFEQLTMDTPCGYYVDSEEDNYDIRLDITIKEEDQNELYEHLDRNGYHYDLYKTDTLYVYEHELYEILTILKDRKIPYYIQRLNVPNIACAEG